MFSIGTFNILADGLSRDEFFSVNSVDCARDEVLGGGGLYLEEDCNRFTSWRYREKHVIEVIREMLASEKCSVVVTQENDHFFFILRELRERLGPAVRGVYARNFDIRAGKHSTSYKILSKRQEEGEKRRSFLEECGEDLLSAACEFYGAQPNDSYLSDDGIGFYYMSDRVTLQSVSPVIASASSEERRILSNDVALLIDAPHCLKCCFSLHAAAPALIEVYGCHLSSGESVEREIERYDQLEAILRHSVHDSFPIIAMDSNNSSLYERQYPPPNTAIRLKSGREVLFRGALSSLIESYGMKDAVAGQRRNECLKMRNRRTNQLSKAFQFMFDSIDKILVRQAVSLPSEQRSEYQERLSFQRYRQSDYDYFHQLRTNDERRQRFKAYCLDNVFTSCVRKAFSAESEHWPLVQLYPNQWACSDHPPIIVTINVLQTL